MEDPPVSPDSMQDEESEDESPREDVEKSVKKKGTKERGKKRTKTGCLTCRRRRIKCDEGKPTCHNCQKSKRQCEGYNQRVVFKDPLSAYRGPPFSSSSNVTFSERFSGPTSTFHGDHNQQASSSAQVAIAPKPSGSFGSPMLDQTTGAPTLAGATTPGLERKVYTFANETAPEYPGSNNHAPAPHTVDTRLDTVDHSYVPEPQSKQVSPDQGHHYDFDALNVIKPDQVDERTPTAPSHTYPPDWSAGPSTSVTTFYQSYSSNSSWQPHISVSDGPPFSVHAPSSVAMQLPPGTSEVPLEHHPASHTQHNGSLHIDAPSLVELNMEPGPLHSAQVYPTEEDDELYDVSDADTNMEQYDSETGQVERHQDDHYLRDNDIGIVIALQARQETQDDSLRSFTSFIDRSNMLATYVPSSRTSPLKDSMTARIFCHFINVTGPSMSMFERHPANPSLIFQGQPVPKSQQHMWTYTFPTLALQNQGLLHAMLALASLHIAKLQNGPNTASLKHYAIGLRRVAKSVSLHHHRRQPATLAASMLLAFYECWSADHQKWSNHVRGARHLLREIDFAGMTKYMKSVRLQKRRGERARFYEQQGLPHTFYDERSFFQATVDEVDENIVSMLMGKRLRYDEYGRILEDNLPEEGDTKTFSQRELEIYETQRDLFWWYCKQDTYQSILGGGRLFMEYDLWSHCPPRAALGRLNATYGTFDHLILLMGRLADFMAKDLKRKRLAMKANGGWPPAPGTVPPQPAQMPARPGFPQMPQQMPQMPGFNGMVPHVGEAKLPMGFEEFRRQSPESARSDEADLEALRIEAEEEWAEIRNAFSILEDHFGDDFQALGPEFSTPIQTPFGPALQYRTYGIAGIWMNYYMGLIACHRAHPSMPPAAMVAAGIAARQTASFANDVGRIAAGIAPDCSMTKKVNPSVGAAIIESSTCLFVAGVQYQNAAQRAWTVTRLRDIARLTGWQTALAIATGCETSWAKMGEMGKGPPYERTSEERAVPDSWRSTGRTVRALGDKTADGRLAVQRSDRVHYALGILGVEEDFDHLDLDNDEDA